MKRSAVLMLTLLFVYDIACSQSVKKTVVNEKEFFSGYYLAVEPETGSPEGVLMLLAGYGQRAEDILPETKLQNVAYANNILTVAFAAGNKLYADSITQHNLSAVILDILARYKVDPQKFVIGGFSAGGMVAMRYVELCHEFPDKFPVKPTGVFTVDSPIDIFTIWNNLEASAKNQYTPEAAEEAERAMGFIKADHGVPVENVSFYSKVTAFSMDKKLGENEKWLREVAVRTYHEVDVAWRLVNRNQPVSESNYLVTSELINRLLLMGNTKAEFIQSDRLGYRSNGTRHPHSWSIVDEVECIQWIKGLWQ